MGEAQAVLAAGDARKIDRRLSAISQRLDELDTQWRFACSTDAEYRMVEAERKALKQEQTTLKEIKGDL